MIPYEFLGGVALGLLAGWFLTNVYLEPAFVAMQNRILELEKKETPKWP